jgi:CBS domain-containing protein
MRVQEAMTRDVALATPDETIREAAMKMVNIDAGVLPVTEDDRLIGMITDRDIAVRAVAEGLPPDTPVRKVMSREVKYCFEDEDVNDVVRNMADIQVRRLPVMSRDKRLVGIIAVGDIAQNAGARPAGTAIEGISEPGGQHNQSNGGTR